MRAAITIKASKTDPYRQGGLTTDEPGPLFRFANKQVLTRERFVIHMGSAFPKAGLNSDVYAGHSFRIGTATVAHDKGIEDSTIMTLGRWKSNAYQRYIRIPQEHLACILAHIATSTSSKAHTTTFCPLFED